MLEWIISASVLILMIIGLRYLLKGKISLRLQYALWALVLLRLLIPVSFGSSQLSAANAVETVFPQEPVFQQQLPMVVPPVAQVPAPTTTIAEGTIGGADSSQVMVHRSISLASVLKILWICGGTGLGIAILASNAIFAKKLKKNRKPMELAGNLPIFVSTSLDTPCLFGMLSPVVYLTEDAAEDPAIRRHAITHEMTHYRHGDHIWSVLRAIALCVHWFNPLVWLAASLSKKDAELACDEGTIAALGEGERAAYGKTLITLTCEKKDSLLLTATTMTVSKSTIKERITLIVKKPKMAVYTLVAVILCCALAVGCTFTGAKENTKPDVTTEPTETAEATTEPNILGPEGETLPSIPPYTPVDDMTPVDAIDKVFIPGEYYHAVLVQNDVMSETGGISTTPDFLIDIVNQYEWEPVETPDSPTMETTVAFGPTYRAFCVRFYESGVMEFNYANEDVRFWKLKDSTQAENLFEDVRAQFDIAQIRTLPSLICSGQNSAEEIARQYFEVAFQEKLRNLSPGSRFEISDFKMVDLEITGVSPSHTAMTGWIEYATIPVKPEYPHHYGSQQPGTGEFEGMTVFHLAFALRLMPEGYWLPWSLYSIGECPMPPEIEEDITPEAAVEKIFGVTSENVHYVFFHYNENGSYGFQCKDLTDTITYIVNNYSWTKLPNAAYPEREKSVYFTGSVWENTELRITESGLLALRFGNDYVVWQLSDPGRASEFFMNIRMNAESAVSSTDYLVIPGDTPEEAAENFVKEVYRDFRMSKPSGWSTAITDYKVVDWDIMDVSEEKDAVVAQFAFATIPEDWDSPMLWVGNTREGTGEFEGMLIDYREFVLQLQEDGTWRCTGFGTGGYTLP